MDVTSINHKTVFVLDHSSSMLELSGETTDIDIGNRRKNVAASMPVTKTIWSLCVEAIVEYCRVIFDLFGLAKVFSLITSDTEGKVLTVWLDEDQNLDQLMTVLREEGPPRGPDPGDSSISVMHGIVQAGKVLSIPSPRQKQAMAEGKTVENRGRVIVITSGLDSEGEKNILESATANFADLEVDEVCLSIKEVELYIMNIRLLKSDYRPERGPKWMNKQTRVSVIDVPADLGFVRQMLRLCQQHYDLSSTTVCDIPMKEEAPGGAGQAGNNKNYKVELLHASAAHKELQKANGMENARKEAPKSGFVSSLLLKWLTPKSPAAGKPELHNCSGTFRITTADVCNRASTCLVTFLLGGRAVMLEQRTSEEGGSSGQSVTTHMLASHGGDLYMHTLAYHRNPLEEPTTITECIGGKCTDYRIQDFTVLMDSARLAPSSEKVAFIPIDRAFSHLERQTRYWPMAISESLIFQESMLSLTGPILSSLPKEYMAEEEVEGCKKCILELLGMEARCTVLPLVAIATRNKGAKRQEQYRTLFTELEFFLYRFVDLSPTHKKLLTWYLQTAGRRINTGDPRPEADRPTGLRLLDERLREAKVMKQRRGKEPVKTEPVTTGEPPEKKWKLETGQQLKKTRSHGTVVQHVSQEESTLQTTEPNFGTEFSHRSSEEVLVENNGSATLLSLMTQKCRRKIGMRQEFAGRLEAMSAGRAQAQLYQHLHSKEVKSEIS